MTFGLSAAALAAGHRLIFRETLASTMTEATRLAALGETGPVWIVAGRQSAGVGRRGSVWHDPPGNLATSLLQVTDHSPRQLATLGFVAGIAVHGALSAVCGDDRFRLKWPNDVLVDGAKVVGILLTAEQLGDGRRVLVVGIGVNVVESPAGLAYRTTSLHGLGFPVSAEQVFEALSSAWVEAYDAWCAPSGFDEVRRRWLTKAGGIGERVAVSGRDTVLRGTFETIDDDGRLVVRLEDGAARTVSAGEVHFGLAASALPELHG